jgi:DNA-binding transcriptional ArsR family regulator
MRIKFVRRVKGGEMVNEFEKKYDSLENLKRHIKENKEDYIALMDYEDWKHFIENPEVIVEEGEIIVTDAAFLTVQKLELLEAIKKFEPETISELAEKVDRDFKSVYVGLKELEAAGLIEFEEAGKEKKVELRCNEIIITI